MLRKLLAAVVGLGSAALIAAVVGVMSAAPAVAVTLTFDEVSAFDLIAADTYSESGFKLTASTGGTDPHYGDGPIEIDGVFDWHSGGTNATTQGWTLTTIGGGGGFNLIAFDFLSGVGDLRVYGD